ncbi:MAG: L,D-transpeptidase [Acidobacteria bacterium]|nr:L,D-transpeptidase [Acidobacteriota bacterium]
MKRLLNHSALVAALLLAVGASACQPVPTGNTSVTNTTNTATTNKASPSATPTPTASSAISAANLPVTLPVLDAMFAEEAFAGELKSRLQLTDEQIARLRKIARDETAGLKEGAGEDHQGSTSEATRRAAEKISEVVGAEKAQAFTAFVGERWSGGEAGAAGAASSKPNSVPTDTRIVVNAPAYRMDVFENGQLVKTYRVGIGYPEFPLPQGQRKATTVIFNPTWTPPDEPWVEASGKVKVGEKVEAGSPLNPLGPVKIPIGSPSLIHGGKSPAKLGTFASHGCVGLTNQQVLDVAQVIGRLGGTEIKPEDVAAYGKAKTETKNVKLARDVPVELRYETIVVEDGRLHVYRDVYDKNTNTEENLRAVLAAYGVALDSLTEQERAQIMAALTAMARDAKGNPTDGAPAATPTPAKNANEKAGKKPDKKDGDRVTRTVKGQKEVVIEIAALRGKGYPAPVNLSGGELSPQKKAAAPKKKK